MTPSNRILLNAGATYAQTACSLVLGLLCGRWVYLALGKDNYGLFSVVGALISFIGFVNSTVILGAGRFFAFAIGVERKRDSEPDLLCKWINVAFNVHIVLPFLLVCIGWPIGCRYVATGLVIDESLRTAAQVVFVCSLFTMFQTMAFGPVFALYTAKQLIFVRNLSGIVLSVFFAAEGWWLLHYSGDRLRAHAVLTCVIQLIVNLALLALAYRQFPEFRIRRRYWFDWKRMKEMCSFSLFSLIGALGPLFSNAGVAIVLNRFGGTALNAAYGASNHIYVKTGTISGAVTEAINPEITTRVGAGDKEAAERLARRECVWSSVLAACVCVPGICFADQVLRLWLQTPPEKATLFLEIMLATILTERVSSGYSTLIHSKGRIKTYVLTVGLANAARCFIVVFLLFVVKFSLSTSLWLGWFLPFLVLNQVRIPFCKWLVGIGMGAYLSKVFLPVLGILFSSFLFCICVKGVWDNSLLMLLATGVLNAFWVFLSSLLFLPKEETALLLSKMNMIRKNLFPSNSKGGTLRENLR
jgi:O-antigen/teichoic acid export membrane protein